MIELGIIGSKNSGKTTLIELLVKKLTGIGLQVATVKHSSHHHQFDIPGKDTDRHRKAGAGLTVAISDNEMALYTKRDDNLLKRFKKTIVEEGYDLCLVEGDRNSNRFYILLTKNLKAIENLDNKKVIASYGPLIHQKNQNHFELSDAASLSEFILSWYQEQIKQLEGLADAS